MLLPFVEQQYLLKTMSLSTLNSCSLCYRIAATPRMMTNHTIRGLLNAPLPYQASALLHVILLPLGSG
jgi:hypothetical protein